MKEGCTAQKALITKRIESFELVIQRIPRQQLSD